MKKIILFLYISLIFNTLNAQVITNVCNGEDVFLHITPPVNATIQWQESTDGIIFSDILNATLDTLPIIGVQQNAYYRAVITEATCRPYYSEVNILNVNSLPNVSISGMQNNMCINDNPATIFTSPAGGTLSGNGITGISFDPLLADTGTHTISYTYTDTNNCTSSASLNVQVNPLPEVDFTGLDSAYCINYGQVNLTGIPSGGFFNGQGVGQITFNTNAAGLGVAAISYIYTDSNSCSNTITKQTFVHGLPIVNFSGLALNYCISDSSIVHLTGTPVGGIFSGTGLMVDSILPIAQGLGTHSATYTYTDSNNCSNSFTRSYTIVDEPSIANAGTDTSLSGTSYQLNANNPTVGSGTWAIVNGTGGSLSSTSIHNPLLFGQINTVYTLTWTISNPPCANTVDTVLVSFTGVALPTVTCNGAPLYVHPTDNFGPIAWGCVGITTAATSDDSGHVNTAIIMQLCNPPTAANICDTLTAYGFSDWYLPSYNELECLRQNAVSIGGFTTGAYWSSTEGSGILYLNAKYRTFPSGTSGVGSKNNTNRVRCVRK